MATVKIYGEQREVVGTVAVDGIEYRAVATGLKRIKFLLVTPRGGIYDLIADDSERMIATDKSGRRPFGRTVFTEVDGVPVVARKWEVA